MSKVAFALADGDNAPVIVSTDEEVLLAELDALGMDVPFAESIAPTLKQVWAILNKRRST